MAPVLIRKSRVQPVGVAVEPPGVEVPYDDVLLHAVDIFDHIEGVRIVGRLRFHRIRGLHGDGGARAGPQALIDQAVGTRTLPAGKEHGTAQE